MRYYFDTDEVAGVLRDDQGVELASIEAAEEAAVAALGDIARDKGSRQELPVSLAMNVRDETGAVLLTAALSMRVERQF